MAVEGSAVLSVTDYKDMIRKLNKIEPSLGTALKRNLKDLAQGPRAAVRSAIPPQPPIKGMRRKLSPVGKTWNTRVNSRTVTIKMGTTPTKPTLGVKPLGIVKLVVSSPATIIADMAGRGKMKSSIDGRKTDWYVYPNAKGTTENTRPGQRRHTVNKQGYAMIDALGQGPSRYAYPAAEKAMPEFTEGVERLLDYVADEIERG